MARFKFDDAHNGTWEVQHSGIIIGYISKDQINNKEDADDAAAMLLDKYVRRSEVLDGQDPKEPSKECPLHPVDKPRSIVGTRPESTKPVKGGAEWRKQRPIARGVLDYFPDAIMEVAYCSWVCNEQHHPGKGLHWDKSKSTDEADSLIRHLSERGTLDNDGVKHSAKVAWRALALLQREIDGEEE